MRNWSCKQRTRPQSGSMFVGGVVLSGRVNMSNWKSIRSRFRLLCTEPVRDLTCFSLTCSLGRIKFMELRYYWRHLIQRKALNITIVWINSRRWIDFMQFYLNDCFDFSFLFFFSFNDWKFWKIWKINFEILEIYTFNSSSIYVTILST